MERPPFKVPLYSQIMLLLLTALAVFVPFLIPALVGFGFLMLADMVSDGFRYLATRDDAKIPATGES